MQNIGHFEGFRTSLSTELSSLTHPRLVCGGSRLRYVDVGSDDYIEGSSVHLGTLLRLMENPATHAYLFDESESTVVSVVFVLELGCASRRIQAVALKACVPRRLRLLLRFFLPNASPSFLPTQCFSFVRSLVRSRCVHQIGKTNSLQS